MPERSGMRSGPAAEMSLTRLKSERPMESRRPESALAMFRNTSSFLGRLSSMGDLSSVPSRDKFRERAFSLRDLEYAKLDGMVFTSGPGNLAWRLGRLKLRQRFTGVSVVGPSKRVTKSAVGTELVGLRIGTGTCSFIFPDVSGGGQSIFTRRALFKRTYAIRTVTTEHIVT